MVKATFIEGNTLYCVLPSKSKSGNYIMSVENIEGKLVVTHSCPASKFKNECLHVREAVNCYLQWRWWEQLQGIVTVTKHVALQPTWEQIPVPGSIEDTIDIVWEAECHVTEYFGYSDPKRGSNQQQDPTLP